MPVRQVKTYQIITKRQRQYGLLAEVWKDGSPESTFQENIKAQNSLAFDTCERAEEDRKLDNHERIPKDKENNFCSVDTSDTVVTLETEGLIERRNREEILDYSLYEEAECTNSASEENISVEGDTSESEYNIEEYGDATIQEDEHIPKKMTKLFYSIPVNFCQLLSRRWMMKWLI